MNDTVLNIRIPKALAEKLASRKRLTEVPTAVFVRRCLEQATLYINGDEVKDRPYAPAALLVVERTAGWSVGEEQKADGSNMADSGQADFDDRVRARLEREPRAPVPTPEETQRRMSELGLVWKPYVPEPPKPRRRRTSFVK